jgi:hypothetical protein
MKLKILTDIGRSAGRAPDEVVGIGMPVFERAAAQREGGSVRVKDPEYEADLPPERPKP